MSFHISLVAEVEGAIAGDDPIRRIQMLRRMTSLFVERSPQLGEAGVDVLDQVILRLARDIEFKARVELAERLAASADAPPATLRDLACDPEAAVAGPVLRRSAQISEGDLVTIARERGQGHLMAIARRQTLSESVTEVLVERGDPVVRQTVAGNAGARFSEGSLAVLLDEARTDDALQRALATRSDLMPDQVERLVEIARARALQALTGEGAASPDLLRDALDRAVAGASRAGTRALVGDFAAAMMLVDERARAGWLGEEDVAGWIRAGRIEEALAALARLADLPVDMVARAYHAAHYDPLIFILRSLRFDWATFKLLLAAKSGRQPPGEVMKRAFDAYQQLSGEAAYRVVRFTAARERAKRADAA